MRDGGLEELLRHMDHGKTHDPVGSKRASLPLGEPMHRRSFLTLLGTAALQDEARPSGLTSADRGVVARLWMNIREDGGAPEGASANPVARITGSEGHSALIG